MVLCDCARLSSDIDHASCDIRGHMRHPFQLPTMPPSSSTSWATSTSCCALSAACCDAAARTASALTSSRPRTVARARCLTPQSSSSVSPRASFERRTPSAQTNRRRAPHHTVARAPSPRCAPVNRRRRSSTLVVGRRRLRARYRFDPTQIRSSRGNARRLTRTILVINIRVVLPRDDPIVILRPSLIVVVVGPSAASSAPSISQPLLHHHVASTL